MKAILYYLLPVYVLFVVNTNAQCEGLTEILESESGLEVKQKRIDILIKSLAKEKNRALADCYHNIGSQWFYANWNESKSPADLQKAIRVTQKAATLKSNFTEVDTASLKQSLYNLGYFQRMSNAYIDAISSYEKILYLGGQHGFSTSALRSIGRIYIEVGDFRQAIDIFEEIIESSITEPDNWELLLQTYILTADAYATMDYTKNESRIEYWLNRAELILHEQNMEDSFEMNQIRIIRGNLWSATNRIEQAISEYKLVLEKPASFDSVALAITNNDLGLRLMEYNDLETSEGYFQKAIALDSSYSDPYENLGDFYSQKKEFGKAMSYYLKAVNLASGIPQEIDEPRLPTFEDLELVPNKIKTFDHLVVQGNGWAKYYENDGQKSHLGNALKSYVLADKLADIIQFENNDFRTKFHWRDKESNLYLNAVKVCHKLGKSDLAFYFMERNKAFVLLKDLSKEEAEEIADIPTEKAQREFQLKRNILLAENQLQNLRESVTPDSLSKLKQAVRNHRNAHEKYVDTLHTDYPEYALHQREMDVMSFEDFRSDHISDQKATVQYILNEEDGFGLLTTADTVALYRLENIGELNDQVEGLLAGLSKISRDLDGFQHTSHSIFSKVLPKKIFEKIKGKQVTIIPDFSLQQIPYESLITDPESLRYLFQDTDLGYAYSASLLHTTKKNQGDSSQDFLGIAPVAFDHLKLPELYFSEEEIRNVAGTYQGEILTNEQATKANFIENADDHSILHLSTHADVGDGENPWIAFNDSKMYLKEIYATKNRADMVVLSGCNTSRGELKRGEGVMSLARGFFYSGAKSVVSTLWPVSDETGGEILVDFYKNLKQGDTKSKALQKAKLKYLNTTEESELRHPYYWAGFVVLGDNAPLSDKPLSLWIIVPLALLGTGLCFLAYRKFRSPPKLKAPQAAA